jgi:hypothetical protein
MGLQTSLKTRFYPCRANNSHMEQRTCTHANARARAHTHTPYSYITRLPLAATNSLLRCIGLHSIVKLVHCQRPNGTLQEVGDYVRGRFLWKGQPTNTYRTRWASPRALEGQQNQKRGIQYLPLETVTRRKNKEMIFERQQNETVITNRTKSSNEILRLSKLNLKE